MKIITICFCLYFIFCPFYFFPSGLPQISDFILIIAVITFFFQRKRFTVTRDIIIKYLRYFITIVLLINSIHFFISLFMGIDYIMSIAYYIFNAVVFIVTLFIIKNCDLKQINILYYAIIISLIIQTVLGILGITKGGFDENENTRSVIFFNNPNQLGYYTLLMYTLFVLISYLYSKKNILVFSFVTFICMYLSLIAVSRSAMGGMFFLISISILLREKLSLVKIISIVFILIISIVSFIVINSDFIVSRQNIYESRQLRDKNRDSSEFENRGYDRIIEYPEYIFLGAGEGQNYRFVKAHHQGEFHSGIGIILFCYGIPGLMFFILFVKKIVQDRKWLGFFVLFPIGFYNLTHQGLRVSLFWMILALLYYICSLSKHKIKKIA